LKKQSAQEEELRTQIYKLYSKFKDEPSSERRQTYLGKLCELATKWCFYFTLMQKLIKQLNSVEKKFKNEMGREIFEAVNNCLKKDKMPQNKFFSYFYTALKIAVYQFYRNQIVGSLKTPQDIIKERKNMRDLREMWESDLARKLTQNEFERRYAIWNQISEEEAHNIYLETIGIVTHFDSIDKEIVGDDGKDTTIIEIIKARSLTVDETDTEPELKEEISIIIRYEFERFLSKQQERTKDIYRALFTVFCIKNKIEQFPKIYPILDSEILEDYLKTEIIPNAYDIYMKKRPGITQKAAESGASRRKKEIDIFIDKLQKTIKEHPEIFSKYKRSLYSEDKDIKNK